MMIGITDCLRDDKLRKYFDWVRNIDPSTEFQTLSSHLGNVDAVSNIDGLLLTGGGDVDPDLYGSSELRSQAKDVDRNRDDFELEVIRRALEADLPILGICRGLQMVNVALGGSLHIDLKSNGFNEHSPSAHAVLKHSIAIEPNSLLSGLAGGLQQEVNSYHHQAVEQLGKGLASSAQSPDGVIEAAEWMHKEGMSFLLLVQWHPERSNGVHDEFSTNLAKIFLREVQYSISNTITNTGRR